MPLSEIPLSVVIGLNVIVLPSLAESCWKNDGGKFCYTLAYGGSIGQAAWDVHEGMIHKVDLSNVHPIGRSQP